MAPRMTPGGYQNLSVTEEAFVPLSPPLYKCMYPKAVVISCEDADARFRLDEPSLEEIDGHLFASGDTLVFAGKSSVSGFKAIATTSTPAALRCTYFY